MNAFKDPDFSLRAVISVLSIGLVIRALELLWNWRELRPGGVLHWDLLWDGPVLAGGARPPRFRIVFDTPGFLIVIALQIVASVSLLLGSQDPVLRPLALTALVLLLTLDRLRQFSRMLVGSDGMFFIIVGALWIRELAPSHPVATLACLWFIALQSCLSYSANGFAKLPSAAWRQGGALRRTAWHPVYGSPKSRAFVEAFPALEKWLGWSVVGFEVAFPFALLGPPVCWIFFGWGVMFHVANAVFLGLNLFMFAWLATYPALVFVALR
jgi:hypothetical protein